MVYIKVREKGKKRYWFITPTQDCTLKRIHAARVDPAKAKDIVSRLSEMNPELEFDIRPIA